MRVSPQSIALFIVASLLTWNLSFAADPFSQGSKRVSVILGAGNSFDESYVIVGVGAGYYVLDGLEIGLNWQTWLGGDPRINQLTPEITYVFRNKTSLDPYIGALYRKTWISGYDDLSAYGGRAGVFMPAGPRFYIGVGAVYLKYTGCSESVYRDCEDVYPEFMFSIPL
jgi:hypothetical protein